MGDHVDQQHIDTDDDIPNPKSQNKGQGAKSSINNPANKQAQDKDQILKSNLLLNNSKNTIASTSGMKNSKSMVAASDLKNVRNLQQNDSGIISRSPNTKPINFRITPNSKANNTTFSFEAPNNFDTIKALVLQDSTTKGYAELEEENRKLRNYLREMNETLNKLVERQGIAKLVSTKKHIEFEQKPVEDQLRTYVQEGNNNEKIIRIKSEEFQKVKARLAQLQNANYIVEVEEKIEQGKKQLEELQRGNKDLKLKNTTSGKDLDSIENVNGAPPNIMLANQREKELITLRKKNDKIKAENNKFDEQVKEQMKRIAELEVQIQKLGSLASHYGIELNVSADKQRFLALMKEIKEQEELLKVVAKRNDKYMENFYRREIEELKILRMRDEEHLAKLEQMMDEQSVSLKDLLSRESIQSDKSIRDLFNKLKVSAAEPKQDLLSAEKKISVIKPSPTNKAKFVKKTIQTKNGKEEPPKGLQMTSPSEKISKLDASSKKLPSDQLPKAQDLQQRSSSQDRGSKQSNGSQSQLTDEKATKDHQKEFEQELDPDEEALLREEEEIQRQEKLLEEQREQEALKKRQQDIERQIQERKKTEPKKKQEEAERIPKDHDEEHEDVERIPKDHDEEHEDVERIPKDHDEQHEDAERTPKNQDEEDEDAELKELKKEHPSLKLPEKTQKDKIVKLNNELEDTPISHEKFKSSQNDPLKLPEYEGVQQKKELIKKPVEYQPPLKLNFDNDKLKKQVSKEINEEGKTSKSGGLPSEKSNRGESDHKSPKELNNGSKASLKRPENSSRIKGENSVFINPTQSNSATRKKDDEEGLLFDEDDQGGADQKKIDPNSERQEKIEGLLKKETSKEKEANNDFFADIEDL